MPVSRMICCVHVIWVACLLEGRGMESLDIGSDLEIGSADDDDDEV